MKLSCKRIAVLAIVFAVLIICCLLIYIGVTIDREKSVESAYGVFVGLDSENIDVLDGYDTVVIDASEFSVSDIQALHKQNKKVFSYLNIGSVEKYRSYYKRFESNTLGIYENWPDERWIDVSCKEWQDYLINTIAADLVKKGIDGFFLDNADVYDCYTQDEIYIGLLDILQGLKQYDLKTVINGGDTFVTKALQAGDIIGLVDGVNQEAVFTGIDFENEKLEKQDAEVTAFFQEYLARCKQSGLEVYLTEYGADKRLLADIVDYCNKNGFSFYNANSINLNES